MIRLALAGALCLMATAARAEPPGMPGEPAFVEHRLALQISDKDPGKQNLVLSVANNMLKAYGPDHIAIEVVAFGPGIDFLRQDSPNDARIRSLVAQGVRFDACMNTVQTIERETGKPYPLLHDARPVEAGVMQLIDLSEHGYTLVRP